MGTDQRAFMEVLGGLLNHHIHGIVTGNDAHQTPAAVQHRQGQQIVLADQSGHFFLGGGSADTEHRAHHQLLYRQFGCGKNQLAQGQRAEQVALLVEHVGLVDGFGISGFAAQHVDGLARAQAAADAGVMAAHQRPCGTGRVATGLQQVVAASLGLFARQGQAAQVCFVDSGHIDLQAATQLPGVRPERLSVS
ncbi:hypothetical protein D9M71_452600 [compost metagenome]